MTWRRIAAAFLGLGVGLVAGLVWAGSLGQRLHVVGPATAQEAAGTDTYVLSDPEIRYPYDTTPPGDEPLGGGDPTRAGVSFATRWSGSRFPGEVWCTAILRDSKGDVVGQERFSALAVIPVGRLPLIAVEVTEEPASAEARCEPGNYEPGPGYTFDQVQLRPAGARATTVTATARWANGVDPSYRICELRASLTTGTSTFRFGLAVPDGTVIEEHVPAPASDVKEVAIACSPVPERSTK